MNEALLVGGVVCGALVGLTLMSSGETVRTLIDRLFMIPLSVPEIVRNGSRNVIDRTRGFMARSAQSTGLSGEHAVQRIAGAVILTLCTLLGTGVSVLTLILTLMGAYGAGENEIISALPVSVETLMAVELIAGLILFGVLLLDVVGTTHITKFFSGEKLSKAMRYVYGTVFAAGLVASVTLLGVGGLMRGMSYQGTPTAEAAADTAGISIGGEKETASLAQAEPEEGIPEIPEGYTRALKVLTVGIPVVSAVAGAAGAVGILPFMSMLIQLPLFVIVIIGLGIIWAISYGMHVIINLIYNFCYSLANIFISLGEKVQGWIGRRATPEEPALQPVERGQTPAEPQAPAGDAKPACPSAAPPPSQPQPEPEPLYTEKDVNWNPLG